jgi:hypothetical protein
MERKTRVFCNIDVQEFHLRLVMYVLPVLLLSIGINIPKYFETRILDIKMNDTIRSVTAASDKNINFPEIL